MSLILGRMEGIWGLVQGVGWGDPGNGLGGLRVGLEGILGRVSVQFWGGCGVCGGVLGVFVLLEVVWGGYLMLLRQFHGYWGL